MARQIREQLGLQPGSPGAEKTSGSQRQGWVSVHYTQSPTPLTVRDAPEESCLLVTGSNLQSNKDELLGNNGMQQAPSTPKGEGPKAEASGTKSKVPRAEALRTQTEEARTEPLRA